MPIPNPNRNERENDYISRCMSEIGSEYESNEQAVAVCYATWRKDKMSKLTNTQSKVAAYIQYDSDFRGINLFANDLEDSCWEGYVAIGTKELDGKVVPNCVPEGENMESVNPSVSSTYPGEVASGSVAPSLLVAVEGELVIHGYHTKNFKMCPGATALFEHILTMPLEEEYIGMVRSAAQIADNVFGIEKDVLESKESNEEQLREVNLLVGDFKDIIEEIDEETEMVHDTSFMDRHIEVVQSFLK